MVKTRRNPTNRSKQPVTAMPNNKEIPEYKTDIQEPKTLIRLVKTNKYKYNKNKNKDNTREGLFSLYK